MIKIIFTANPLRSKKVQKYEFIVSTNKNFLVALDKFLKKSKINKSSLKHCLAVVQDEGFITQRIIATIIKTINLVTANSQNFSR